MRAMRPQIAIVLLSLSLAALAGGCGKGEATTPAACLEGSGAYLKTLADAPGEVRLAGEVPISDCLAEGQSGGDLAAVGEATVEAATKLDAEARAEPGGQANLELGYLVGAVQRGAEGTEGIHSELVRRLAVAARYSPGHDPLSPAFKAAYQRGFDTGREDG
jgi:hypothetical protein